MEPKCQDNYCVEARPFTRALRVYCVLTQAPPLEQEVGETSTSSWPKDDLQPYIWIDRCTWVGIVSSEARHQRKTPNSLHTSDVHNDNTEVCQHNGDPEVVERKQNRCGIGVNYSTMAHILATTLT